MVNYLVEKEVTQGILQVIGSAFAGAGTTALAEWLKRKNSEGLTQDELDTIYRSEIVVAKARSDIERVKEGKARITGDFKVVDISDDQLGFPSKKDWLESEEPLQVVFQVTEQERKLERAEDFLTLQEINNYAYRHAGAIPPDERQRVSELDPAWLRSWKDYAKKATFEDLKKMYAKILVGKTIDDGDVFSSAKSEYSEPIVFGPNS